MSFLFPFFFSSGCLASWPFQMISVFPLISGNKEVSSQKWMKNLRFTSLLVSIAHGAPGSHQLQCHLPASPGHDCPLSQDLQLWGSLFPTRSQQPNAPCVLNWGLSGVLSPCPKPFHVHLLVGPASSLPLGLRLQCVHQRLALWSHVLSVWTAIAVVLKPRDEKVSGWPYPMD